MAENFVKKYTDTDKQTAAGSPGGCGRKKEGILMSVKEMGDTLGLKKTERYRLMHMGFFETTVFLGKMMVVRESFEQWYAGQVRYHKVNGEAPGRKLREWSWSVQDVSDMLGMHPATVYALISRDGIETVEADHTRRIPKDVFDRWYEGQDRYKKVEMPEGLEPGQMNTVSKLCRKPQKNSGNGEYMTVEEAVSTSGFSRTSISKWIRDGHFRTQKAGRIVRIKKTDFDEWINQIRADGKGERNGINKGA